MADRPFLPENDRAILLRRGWLKPPSHPGPPVPKADDMIFKALAKGLEITVTGVTEEDDKRKRRPTITAVVNDNDGHFFEAGDSHAGVACGRAIAAYLRATEPQQVPMPVGEGAEGPTAEAAD